MSALQGGGGHNPFSWAEEMSWLLTFCRAREGWEQHRTLLLTPGCWSIISCERCKARKTSGR